MRRGLVLGGAGAVAAVAVAVAVVSAGGGGSDRLAAAPAAQPVTGEVVTSGEAVVGTTAPPEPATTTTAAAPGPTSVPDADAPPPGDGVPATPDPPRPPGPLPTGCLSYGNACAYPGATGATPGGVWDISQRLAGTSLHVSWRPEEWGSSAGAKPTEFVLSLGHVRPGSGPDSVYYDASRMVRVRLPYSARSYRFDGLLPGETYVFWIQELNSSGLSQGVSPDPVTVPKPSPKPSPSPARTPSPKPSATPAATPSATPSATPTVAPSEEQTTPAG